MGPCYAAKPPCVSCRNRDLTYQTIGETMNRSGNECYVALHHICLNEVIVNQFLPDDFELSLQLLDLLFANLRVEIPVALCELQLERHLL